MTPPNTVRALTLTQPWADAVASGTKQWETRSWRTDYRGPLLIHAAKGFPAEAKRFAEAQRALGRGAPRVALGAVVAIASLFDVRPAEEVALEVSAIERLYGDYTPGRYAWRLEHVRRLAEPVPATGALGLWRPGPALLDAVEAELTLGVFR